MRILLLAWGSRGDVQPYLALALGLRAAGYDVSVAAPRDFRDWVLGQGVGYEEFPVDLSDLARTELGRAWLGGGATSTRHEYAMFREVLRLSAEPLADTIVRTLPEYDAFISGAISFEAMLAPSRVYGKRHVMGLLQPSLVTTDPASYVYAPQASPFGPSSFVDATATAAVGTAISLGIRGLIRPAGDVVRARLGLGRLTMWRYLRDSVSTPVLVAVSPLVAPRPTASSAADVSVTGYWFLDEPSWVPDPELTAFLAAGPPPVYVGFGSMTAQDPQGTMHTILAALAESGQRGVILRGLADLHAETIPDDVLVIDSAPHLRLFPLMRAVVHHGGAGTTGAALHAGVPQVVVPHMGDQPYFARRMEELGVAPSPLRRQDLSVHRLAGSIRLAVSTPSMATRAAELGAQVRAEDGVGNAVRELARILGEGPDQGKGT